LNHQMLLDEVCGKLTSEQHKVIKASEREVSSVVSLIDDILAFAQMRGGTVSVTLADLPVRRAIERAAVSLRHRFQQAELTLIECPADPPLVGRYDANRLQQIVLNLLNNALKFTPRGGTITLGDRRDGDAFVIDVSDTGCGIPAEQMQRVFEPFVQLQTVVESNEKPGVGLGLAICRDLAFAMGGTIRVQSTVGAGSTFSVALPLASVPRV
ncbi:MAG: ATP-binding protein, partial [Opitutaceae bacterium]